MPIVNLEANRKNFSWRDLKEVGNLARDTISITVSSYNQGSIIKTFLQNVLFWALLKKKVN